MPSYKSIHQGVRKIQSGQEVCDRQRDRHTYTQRQTDTQTQSNTDTHTDKQTDRQGKNNIFPQNLVG